MQATGSFDVGDCEASEAGHKTSMRLAANRVRHLQPNRTRENMRVFLCRYHVFEALKERIPELSTQKSRRRFKPGLATLLHENMFDGIRFRTHYVQMGDDLASVETQQQFIHPQVRVARLELMDLICGLFNLSKSRSSYSQLEKLKWSFGQQLRTESGEKYWATDNAYGCFQDPERAARRDILQMNGTESTCLLYTSPSPRD